MAISGSFSPWYLSGPIPADPGAGPAVTTGAVPIDAHQQATMTDSRIMASDLVLLVGAEGLEPPTPSL
jgi:hypothetical protein